MIVYCDSSTQEACYIIREEAAIVVPYGQKVTVNEGEYRAVILALTEALTRNRTGQLRLLTDSQLVVNQVSGIWNCHFKHLEVLRDKVRALARDQDVVFEWVPRDENLAGRALEKRGKR